MNYAGKGFFFYSKENNATKSLSHGEVIKHHTANKM